MAVKPKPVSNRNLVVTLPEDKMLKFVDAASRKGLCSHAYAAALLLEAIK